MRTVNFSRPTKYGTTLEEEIIRFVDVMQDGGIAANGVLIETEFPSGDGPAMAHFGRLDGDNVVKFWASILKILVEYPIEERSRVRIGEEQVN